MADELNWMTAADLVRGYERGDFTPEEATDCVFSRIDAVDGKLNTFRELDQDRAMDAAVGQESGGAREPRCRRSTVCRRRSEICLTSKVCKIAKGQRRRQKIPSQVMRLPSPV